MVKKCAALKCASDYGRNEKKQISKFHFPLKIAELNKQWIHFVNRKEWLATKHSMLCELHFEEKYLWRGEEFTLQWSVNPVHTSYPEKLLSKLSSLPSQQTIRSLLRKTNFKMICQHLNNVT